MLDLYSAALLEAIILIPAFYLSSVALLAAVILAGWKLHCIILVILLVAALVDLLHICWVHPFEPWS